MRQTRKLYSIEALRFFMMLMICYWHCYGRSGFLCNGYIAVEWFFVLSGILMYQSYCRHPETGVFDYTLHKYLRFAPEYLLVVAYCYLRHSLLPFILGHRTLDIDFLLRSIPEALMMQDCGFYSGGVNYPMWYLCALLWGGAIVYAFLYSLRHTAILLVFPIIVLLGYTYLFHVGGNGSLQVWDVQGCVKQPMLRGICGMSLGVLLARVMESKQYLLYKYSIVLNVISVVALLFFVCLAFIGKHYDAYGLIAICAMFISCFMADSLLNRFFAWKGWIILGALSWQMLLYHGCIVIPMYESIDKKFGFSQSMGYWTYLFLLLVVCFVLKILYEKFDFFYRKTTHKRDTI